MILLIPIIFYCLIFIGLVFLFNKWVLIKSDEKIRKKTRKTIIIIGAVLFPFCLLLYFSYLFGLALDNHYNVKKGTFLWYATMDNKTITDFPQIDPIGSATFNSIGGDSPSISTGWEIEYTSKQGINEAYTIIKDYLLNEGYTLKAVNETECSWKSYKRDEDTYLFTGVSSKGECLDLTMKKLQNGMTRIEVLILY